MEEVNRVGDEIVSAWRKVGLFAVDVDGTPVTLVSLSPGVLGAIQQRTGLRFNELVLDPLARIDIAAQLVDACYQKLGKPGPSFDDGLAIIAKFVEVPDDLPPAPDVPSDSSSDPPTPAS